MGRTLVLFTQGRTVDVYVNVIAFCVQECNVSKIYFAGENGTTDKEFQLHEKIHLIKKRIEALSKNYSDYSKSLILLSSQIKEHIISVNFDRPQDSIPYIKKKFPDIDNLIIDITSCSKHLAGNIISSFIANNINHVCYFELVDKVYAPSWKDSGKALLYHDLKEPLPHYNYIDFSGPGATIESFNKMRNQGKYITILLVLCLILSGIVFVLILGQQNQYAQIGVIAISFVTILSIVLSSVSDSINIWDRFKR